MIWLRLVYVLRVPLRGSKYDTYRSRACTRVCDHNGHNDGQRDLRTLVRVLNVQQLMFVPQYFIGYGTVSRRIRDLSL